MRLFFLRVTVLKVTQGNLPVMVTEFQRQEVHFFFLENKHFKAFHMKGMGFLITETIYFLKY